MLGLVRDLDLFAVPVSLTYKGKKRFSTLFGGCFSLVLILVFATYAALTLHKMIVNPTLKNNSTKMFFSLVDNPETYKIMTSNSTVAVRVTGDYNYSNFRVVF